MKVFITKPNEGWIVDRMADEWKAFAPKLVTDSLDEADVIWLLSDWTWKRVPTFFLEQKKVVTQVHHIDIDKFNVADFAERDNYTDAYICPNPQVKVILEKFTTKKISVIGNWYNGAQWGPLNKKKCREVLGLPMDKFIIGSFQRDTEGKDLKTPKLIKGPDIFCDYLDRIDTSNVHVLLGGWRRQYVISRLQKSGIPYTFKEKVDIRVLRNMYGALDLYIVASRVEGGPYAVLEAPAMKVPIISNRVGMAEMTLSESSLFDISTLNQNPQDIIVNVNANYQKVYDYSLVNIMGRFIKVFEWTLAK